MTDRSKAEQAPVDIDKLEAIIAKGTPGPWECNTNRHTGLDGRRWGWISGTLANLTWSHGNDNDAKAVVALWNAAPSLLAELRRLRAQSAEAHRNWEREVRELAHTLGIEHTPETGSSEPGPLEAMLDRVRELNERSDTWLEHEAQRARDEEQHIQLPKAETRGGGAAGEFTDDRREGEGAGAVREFAPPTGTRVAAGEQLAPGSASPPNASAEPNGTRRASETLIVGRGDLIEGASATDGSEYRGFVTDECSNKDGSWWIETVDRDEKPANMRLVYPTYVLWTADDIARLAAGPRTKGVCPSRSPSQVPEGMILVAQKDYRELGWNLDGVSGALIDAGDITVCDDDYSKSIRELTAQRDALRKVANAAREYLAERNKAFSSTLISERRADLVDAIIATPPACLASRIANATQTTDGTKGK